MSLRQMVDTTQSRMEDGARQAVRNALKAGAQVTFCGKYSTTGLLVLRVTKPANWQSEAWNTRTELSCTIPGIYAEQTRAWAQRRMAAQRA